MNVQTIFLPRDLTPSDGVGRTVVVFDVLRATTTMTAALACGVAAIRIFDSLEAARAAAAACGGPRVLCGELNALPPVGFDRGNSPRDWLGAPPPPGEILLATTNGTRAIAAAAALQPAAMFIGALVNAREAARAAAATGKDVTLLCSGSNGLVSLEDVIGAGAVLEELVGGGHYQPFGDGAEIARRTFAAARGNLSAALRVGTGGRNLMRVGLEGDIDVCAAINSLSAVGMVDALSLCVRPWTATE